MRRGTLILALVVTTSAFAATPRRRAASPDRCTEVVSPATVSFPSGGGSATVTVTVNGGCTWSPVASDPWLTVTQSANAITVSAAPNSATSSRTTVVHVRSAAIVVTQDATTNLVQNGSFDTDLTGWSPQFSAPGSTASVVNGAAVLTSPPGTGASQLSQCVNISPSTRYEAGAKVVVDSSQPTGLATFGFFIYSTPNCDPINFPQSRLIEPGPGLFLNTPIVWTSDANAKSVLIAIAAGAPTGPFTATFDDVYLRPSP